MAEIDQALRLSHSTEVTNLLARTACLPNGEYKGGTIFIDLNVDGQVSRLYYVVTSVKPYRLQRVLLGNATDELQPPPGLIGRMSVSDIQAYMKITKAMYSHLAKYVTSSAATSSDKVIAFRGTAHVA